MEVTLLLTDEGRRNTGGSLIGRDTVTDREYSCFNVRWFEVGEGGVNENITLAPDPTRTTLISPIDASLQEIYSARINEYNCPKYTCVLGTDIAGELSEIGLWARRIISINNGVPTYDMITPPFLYAYGTFSPYSKSAGTTDTIELAVQY